MPIFHTAILLYDKKQYAIPAIAQRPYTHNKGPKGKRACQGECKFNMNFKSWFKKIASKLHKLSYPMVCPGWLAAR